MAGGAKAIIFELIANDHASSVFERAGLAAEQSATQIEHAQQRSLTATEKAKAGFTKAGAGITAAFGLAAAASVKMAGDFQKQLTLLVTGAGESQQNIKKVSDGILKMAGATGTSAAELAKGMYLIESAGYHGADGLKVLKAAAEGAKTDGADLNVVADALTTVMRDMPKGVMPAATAMSKMVAAVGEGKMRMDDFAGSIHSVLPNAVAVWVHSGGSAVDAFNQVAGAIATMTAQGISSEQATQNLNHTIVRLASPTLVMTKAMAAYGLSATDVSKNLGKRGLTGTLELLETTVMKRMGPAGLTLTNAFNTSKEAAADAARMYAKMPADLKTAADKLKDGTYTIKEYKKDISGLPPQMEVLGRQFLTTWSNSKGFSQMLRSGAPAAQTFSGAMEKLTGGQVGLQVALHLTGENMGTFSANVAKVAGTAQQADGNVKDWAAVQKNFNQQLDRFRDAIDALLIRLGLKLIPILMDAIKFTQDHSTAVKVGVTVMGAFAAAVSAAWIGLKLYQGAMLVAKVATAAWTAAQWLLNAALDANPIGLVVVGLAALSAGLIYAYKHSETFRNIVNAAWRTVADACRAMWNDTIKPVFGALLVGFLTVVSGIVHGAADAFGWVHGVGGKLKGAAREIDKFKDSTNASLAAINNPTVTLSLDATKFTAAAKVLGAGFDAQNAAIHAPYLKGHATGGYTGDGGKFEPAGIVHRGEFVVPKEATARLGVGFLNAISGLPGYATGGFVNIGGIPSAESSIRRDVSYLNAGIGAAAQRIGDAVAQAVQTSLASSGAGGGPILGGSAPGGVARWRDVVLQALSMLGQSPALAPGVLRRMAFESGGNPRAINLWDVNAKNGDPSRGLMQTIGSTFNAYAGPFRGRGIYDPLANVYAGLNYALHRYGSIQAIDPRVRPRGYDTGGLLKPGLTLAYNGTGRDERIRTGKQEDQLALGIAQVELQGKRTVDAVEASARETAHALAAELRRQNVRVEVGV